MDIQHIFVVGAGTMGNGIAQTAAVSGYRVTMMDVIPEQLQRGQASHRQICREVGGKGRAQRSPKAGRACHRDYSKPGWGARGRPGDRSGH